MKFSELATTIQQHQYEDAEVFIYNANTECFEKVALVILGTTDHVIQLQSQLMAKEAITESANS